MYIIQQFGPEYYKNPNDLVNIAVFDTFELAQNYLLRADNYNQLIINSIDKNPIVTTDKVAGLGVKLQGNLASQDYTHSAIKILSLAKFGTIEIVSNEFNQNCLDIIVYVSEQDFNSKTGPELDQYYHQIIEDNKIALLDKLVVDAKTVLAPLVDNLLINVFADYTIPALKVSVVGYNYMCHIVQKPIYFIQTSQLAQFAESVFQENCQPKASKTNEFIKTLVMS